MASQITPEIVDAARRLAQDGRLREASMQDLADEAGARISGDPATLDWLDMLIMRGVRALPLGPQLADHVLFGAIAGRLLASRS